MGSVRYDLIAQCVVVVFGNVEQGVYVYQPKKIREFQRSGKNWEKVGNFVIGQEIFIVYRIVVRALDFNPRGPRFEI